MTNTIQATFDELVTVGFTEPTFEGKRPVPAKAKFVLRDPSNKLVASVGTPGYNNSLKALNELLMQTAMAGDPGQHRMFAEAVREPIRILSRYKSWTGTFFAEDPRAWGDDNKIPVDNPIGAAFYSAMDSRPYAITPGVQQYVRPQFFTEKAELNIKWHTIKTVGWNIMARRLEEVADELARRRDAKARGFLVAGVAANSATHVLSNSGNAFLKASIDSLLKLSAEIGWPITQGAINPGRLMDMTGWTNGSSTSLPYFWAPENSREQVYRQLYADAYGNVRWTVSKDIGMGEIWFSGEPEDIGYHQTHGEAQSASAVDIHLMQDEHVIYEDHAFYIGNVFNVWENTITA